MTKLKYICVHCGDEYVSEIKMKDKRKRYCGYCDVVVNGEPNSKWLPGASVDGIPTKGFHKI